MPERFFNKWRRRFSGAWDVLRGRAWVGYGLPADTWQAQICGACGKDWDGQTCPQKDNGWPHEVCYPMKPNYNEWLTFHDKVAQVARRALEQKADDNPLLQMGEDLRPTTRKAPRS